MAQKDYRAVWYASNAKQSCTYVCKKESKQVLYMVKVQKQGRHNTLYTDPFIHTKSLHK